MVAERLNDLRKEIPHGVTLVAVSKFHPAEAVREAYDAGQRVFGESRADELAAKAAALPSDIRWHFIGHIQTNKLRRILPHVDTIQSVDSEKLLRLIDTEADKAGLRPKLLLQVHVAAETTKTGFSPDELIDVARRCSPLLKAATIDGVMGMATNTDQTERIMADFEAIARTSQRLRDIIPTATILSMGMSGDWRMAVGCGANMVRIGSDIFGPRE